MLPAGAASAPLLLPKPRSASLFLLVAVITFQPNGHQLVPSGKKNQVFLRVKLPLEAAARVILEDLGGNSGAFGHSCLVSSSL